MLQEVFVEVHRFEVHSVTGGGRFDSKRWIFLVKLILHWFVPGNVASVTNECWWSFTLFFFCNHFSSSPWTVLLPIQRFLWLFIVFFFRWLLFGLLFWLFSSLCFFVISEFLVPQRIIAVVSIFVLIFSSFTFELFKTCETWKLLTIISLTTLKAFLAVSISVTVSNTKITWIFRCAERIPDIVNLNWSWIES